MIELRAAQESDVDGILELEHEIPEAPHWSGQEYLRLLERAKQEPPTAAVLVLAEAAAGRLAGFIAVTLGLDAVAELESVAVASEFRGTGWGKRLCAEALEWCRQAGATRCALEVRAGSEGPRRLYRSFAFAEVGQRRNYYHDPSDDAILMSLHLDEASVAAR